MSFLVNLALVLLFSLGLVISGTFVPAKVLNFLDLFGTRGASLAFVMGAPWSCHSSAIGWCCGVMARSRAACSTSRQRQTSTAVRSSVLAGVLVALSGPALTALGLGKPGTLVFLSSRCSLACWRLAPPASGLTCFVLPDKASNKEATPSAKLNAWLNASDLHRRDEREASRGLVGYSGRDAAGRREVRRARTVI